MPHRSVRPTLPRSVHPMLRRLHQRTRPRFGRAWPTARERTSSPAPPSNRRRRSRRRGVRATGGGRDASAFGPFWVGGCAATSARNLSCPSRTCRDGDRRLAASNGPVPIVPEAHDAASTIGRVLPHGAPATLRSYHVDVCPHITTPRRCPRCPRTLRAARGAS